MFFKPFHVSSSCFTPV